MAPPTYSVLFLCTGNSARSILAESLLNHWGRGKFRAWDEFAQPDAPELDFIITVCDNAAGEVCPVWPGKPVTAHWGLPDPAAGEGTDTEKWIAFRETLRALENRIKPFVSLPIASLDRLKLQEQVREIGRMPHADGK